MNKKSRLYQQLDLETRVQNASQLELVQLMYQGVLTALLQAVGAMQRGNIEEKGKLITKALSIIGGLRDTLDQSVASDLPYNLDQLYDYWQRKLVSAHAHNDEAVLLEVIDLVKIVKSGWDDLVRDSRQSSTTHSDPQGVKNDV